MRCFSFRFNFDGTDELAFSPLFLLVQYVKQAHGSMSSVSGDEDDNSSPPLRPSAHLSAISEAEDALASGSESDASSVNGGLSRQGSRSVAYAQHDPVRTSRDSGGLSENVALKSGYLMKKGEKRKTWKKRWFVLRGGQLAMYKTDKVRLFPLFLLPRSLTLVPTAGIPSPPPHPPSRDSLRHPRRTQEALSRLRYRHPEAHLLRRSLFARRGSVVVPPHRARSNGVPLESDGDEHGLAECERSQHRATYPRRTESGANSSSALLRRWRGNPRLPYFRRHSHSLLLRSDISTTHRRCLLLFPLRLRSVKLPIHLFRRSFFLLAPRRSPSFRLRIRLSRRSEPLQLPFSSFRLRCRFRTRQRFLRSLPFFPSSAKRAASFRLGRFGHAFHPAWRNVRKLVAPWSAVGESWVC